jgi:hypothetical protein
MRSTVLCSLAVGELLALWSFLTMFEDPHSLHLWVVWTIGRVSLVDRARQIPTRKNHDLLSRYPHATLSQHRA